MPSLGARGSGGRTATLFRFVAASRLPARRRCSVGLWSPPQGGAVPSFSVHGCGGENGQAEAEGCSVARVRRRRPSVRPNHSLQPTVIGMALGPRSAIVYPAPRGPSAMPLPAAELER